jgi:hypothetical protein
MNKAAAQDKYFFIIFNGFGNNYCQFFIDDLIVLQEKRSGTNGL